MYDSAPNWNVIGQVQVAADKACLADVIRKYVHIGSNWTDYGAFSQTQMELYREKGNDTT